MSLGPNEDDSGNFNDRPGFTPLPPPTPYRTPADFTPHPETLQFADWNEFSRWTQAVVKFQRAHAPNQGERAFEQAIKDADAFIMATRARIETLRTKKT